MPSIRGVSVSSLGPVQTEKDAQQSTPFQTILSTINCIIGTGVLTAGNCFYKMSMSLGIAAMSILGFINWYTFLILGYNSQKTGANSYGEMWKSSIKKHAWIASFLSGTLVFLCTIAMPMLIGDYLLKLSQQFYPSFANKPLLTCGCVTLLTPLCLLKTLSALSFVGTAASLITLLAIAATIAFILYESKGASETTEWYSIRNSGMDLLTGINVSVTMYVGHFNAPSLYLSLEDKSKSGWYMYSGVAFSIISAICIVLGGLLYYYFGDKNTTEDFLKLPVFDGSRVITCVTIAMLLNLMGSYPFFVFGARAELLSLCEIFMNAKESDMLFYCITLVIIVATTFLAFVVTNIGTLFNIVMIFAGNPVVFVLPAVMNLIIEPESGFLQKGMNYLCIIVGIGLSVLGLIALFYQ